ncbi:MAG: ISAzo13 family transposase, partial [Bifidobacteriaceae bacterium]|nr:ISAzo13 family transposase [Bifidobacteriaceae bacterium]
SKWNKIEHRLFSFITMNWRGRPLVSHEVIVHTIAATTTRTGLTVQAELDTAPYPLGQSFTAGQIKQLETDGVLVRCDFHGDWNYTIKPPPRPTAPDNT